MNLIVVGLIAYVLVQFAIGAWYSRHIASEADYILAGRSLGPLLVAFSVFATWFGAEAIVATSGEVYERGLAGALIDPFAYAAALIIAGVVLAAVLWRSGLTTFADLFRERYSPDIERLVVVMLLPGSVFWAAAQIRAFGQVLTASSELDLTTAILVATLLVAAYSVVGGLLADAVTDFLQGLVAIIGIVVLAAVLVSAAGGLSGLLASVPAERLSLLATKGEETSLGKLEQIVIAICGSLVAVELISRFLGARSAEVARAGTIAGGLMYLVIGLIPILLGLAGAELAQSNAELAAKIAGSEQALSALASFYLPGWLYVLFAGALISAILSVVHAALHASAAQVSHNVVVPLRPGLGERAKLFAVRATVAALSVAACVLALSFERIKELVEIASAFGSAGVFVTALFAMFSGIGGPRAAAAAILSGAAVWALGRFALDWTAPYMTALAISLMAYVTAAQWDRKDVPAR
jgi:Na+/proline symporter